MLIFQCFCCYLCTSIPFLLMFVYFSFSLCRNAMISFSLNILTSLNNNNFFFIFWSLYFIFRGIILTYIFQYVFLPFWWYLSKDYDCRQVLIAGKIMSDRVSKGPMCLKISWWWWWVEKLQLKNAKEEIENVSQYWARKVLKGSSCRLLCVWHFLREMNTNETRQAQKLVCVSRFRIAIDMRYNIKSEWWCTLLLNTGWILRLPKICATIEG